MLDDSYFSVNKYFLASYLVVSLFDICCLFNYLNNSNSKKTGKSSGAKTASKNKQSDWDYKYDYLRDWDYYY